MRDTFQSLQEEEEEQEINITPMLDVVFIMLIFFIVTASFVKETGIDVNKPDTDQPQSEQKKNILVRIDASNRIFIDGRRVDKRQVRPNIERLHAQNPQGTVVIQADNATSNEMIVAVMDASRAAGIMSPALAEN
jgi:biopolymer transport protein ExbD